MRFYSESLDTPLRRRRVALLCRLKRHLGVVWLLRAFGHIEGLPLSLRKRIVTAIYRAEYSPSQPFDVGFFGLRYPGDLNCFLDWHVYFFGAYERETLFLLRDLLPKDRRGVFVDIGANVGQHTIFMSKYAAHVHSFEPWEFVRRRLIEKIRINGISNVTVHSVGLGSVAARLPFYAPAGANTGTGSFDPTHATDRNKFAADLDIVNGDEYFQSHSIFSADLIKIDAEGWEKHVLLGLTRTLAAHRPLVLVEISETTLATFASLDDFRGCIPDCYDAFYMNFTPEGVEYSAFDAARPGDVLLRPRAEQSRAS